MLSGRLPPGSRIAPGSGKIGKRAGMAPLRAVSSIAATPARPRPGLRRTGPRTAGGVIVGIALQARPQGFGGGERAGLLGQAERGAGAVDLDMILVLGWDAVE